MSLDDERASISLSRSATVADLITAADELPAAAAAGGISLRLLD